MTSLETQIICTSKQTRFVAAENSNYRELDIEGVTIQVTSAPSANGEAKPTKGKSKGKAEGLEVLTDAKLLLKEGQRYALVGRNGSGKSTLLKAIAERLIPGIPEKSKIAILQQTRLTDDDPPAGKTARDKISGPTVLQEVVERASAKEETEQDIRTLSDGVDATDPYAPVKALRKLQHEKLLKKLAILDRDAKLRSGARGLAARKALVAFEKVVAESEASISQPNDEISADSLQKETQEAADMLAELQSQIEPNRLSQIENRAKTILTGLGFSETYMEKPLASLSGGWHMRAALATVLSQDVDILILDEPTNFLDLLGIIWLQRFLQSLEGAEKPPTLILVSHDRDFINLCTDLLILKDKQLTYFHGTIGAYEASQSERKLWLAKMRDAQDKQKAHIEKSIQANIKAGKANDDQNKLRQAKSRQKKLDDRWGLQVSAKGGRFKLNRDLQGFHLTARAEVDVPPEERPVTIFVPEPPDLRFPGSLISLEKVSYRYSAKTPMIIEDITLSLGMGDRIGVLGLNGAGKSTLIKLLVEETRPSKGALSTHPRLKLGYYSQHEVDDLRALGATDAFMTSLSLLTSEVEDQLNEGEIRALLAQLGLPGRLASDVPLTKLSGGQLVRCALARLVWRRPHCLILDEVTTHLDYETVTALREALSEWEGAVVLVSHDRWFMRGVVEGMKDDDDDDESEEDEEDESSERRRIVYRLKAGKLVKLEGGTEEFEKVMGRRVEKLMA